MQNEHKFSENTFFIFKSNLFQQQTKNLCMFYFVLSD